MAGIGRIVFLGTGAFGVPLLARIASLADELLVVSQPDRPAGRRLQLRATPVAEFARQADAPVLTPRRLSSDEALHAIGAFKPDGLVLVAYGQMVPRELLDLGERQPLNVHPSLLPRHRGAAPVAGTIMAGDPDGGVTLMVMTTELDAGPIVGQWLVPLTGREATPELESRLADVAASVVPDVLEQWAVGAIDARDQVEDLATYVHQFTREDGWIDWRRPAVEIDRQVRALQPWPGAWSTVDGRRLHIRRARPVTGVDDLPIGALLPGDPPCVACGVGALALEVVQAEGRAAMPADAWRHGLDREHVLLGAGRPTEPPD
ncbi:MAG: methionyl-tRNA formyltransferase [Candidatus Limnocylindria bacterium]